MKRCAPRILASIAVLGLAAASPVLADQIHINLGQVYTGATPPGSPDWLSATFTYNPNGTQGTLTLTSLLHGGAFLQGGGGHGVAGWGFNLDAGNALLGWSCATGGACANTVVTSGVNSGPVGGGFNLAFKWTSGNRFDGSESATYTLTFANPLTAASPFTANGDGWLSFAHAQWTGSCSGFIVSGSGKPKKPDGPCGAITPLVAVPEPADLGLMGFGLLLVGAFLGLRRRYS